MKKLLMIAAAGVAVSGVSATPAMANDLAITATANVAPTCRLGGFIRQDTAVSGGAGVGYDATTGAVGSGATTTAVDVSSTGVQTIGSLSGFGNVGCTLSVTTDNGYKLQNGGTGANREIPYSLSISGGPSGNTGTLSLNLGTAPGQPSGQTRTLRITFPTAANPVNLVAGAYTDVIRVTIAPTA